MNARPSGGGMPPLRVLCVDDNHDQADSTAELLRLVGFEAEPCYGGRAALDAAADFHPSLCLIDLNMPGMDGDELACRLREPGDGGWPVLVALTARDDARSSERIAAAGFDLHLVKPVDPHKLIEVVNALWRAWASGAAGRARAAAAAG